MRAPEAADAGVVLVDGDAVEVDRFERSTRDRIGAHRRHPERDFLETVENVEAVDQATEDRVLRGQFDVLDDDEELAAIATGDGASATGNVAAAAVSAVAPASAPAPAAEGDYLAPWIDTPNCTACDECTQLNSNIFEYNADKKAVIKNAEAGPYKDLVKSAEKCTARVIHPGLPRNRNEKGIEKWIKRGEKYN